MPTDLWTFATMLYDRPGVSTDCLALQTQGANVCLVLCAAWLEQRAVTCTPDRANQLRQVAEPWAGSVVSALRALRQRWREDAQQDVELAQLREQVKTLELMAEKMLLQRLEKVAMQWPADDQPTAWLEALAGKVVDDHCALPRLRAAAMAT